METNFTLSISELILCHNLLINEAEELENNHDSNGKHKPFIDMAKDRRELAKRMKAEVDRRNAL